MEPKELQKHVRRLATLDESGSLIISCYLNLEAGLRGLRKVFKENISLLTKGIPQEKWPQFQEALNTTTLRPRPRAGAYVCQPYSDPV